MFTRCNECGKGFDSPVADNDTCPECMSRWNAGPPEPLHGAKLIQEKPQAQQTRCVAKGCTQQATAISLAQNGITFWCQAHNPNLVEAERQLARGGVGGLQREAKLQQIVDELRGSV